MTAPGARLADVIEDCEWMASAGESLTGAAQRLGYSSRLVLERTLWRAGRQDLVTRLKAREQQTSIENRRTANHRRRIHA